MKYNTVSNLRFSSPDESSIDMDVFFVELNEAVPYTASPHDSEAHSRELFEKAMAGKFGKIRPYDGPSEDETLAEQVRSQRNMLLRELDSVVTHPLRWSELSEAQREAIATYRRNLLGVPQQEGFPRNVSWPERPVF